MKAAYIIPQVNLAKFVAEVEKLNKRAAKLGCPKINYLTGHAYNELEYEFREGKKWAADHEVKFVQSAEGEPYVKVVGGEILRDSSLEYTGRVREWLFLTVEGESPKYEGWTFAATLEPLDLEGGGVENLIRAVPGTSIPVEYRGKVGGCDHCHTIRQRTQTFVLQHESGSFKMVGRNCLKDFLGHANPHALATWLELLLDLERVAKDSESEEYGIGVGPSVYTLEAYLSVVGAVVADSGWVSKSRAGEGNPATAYVALTVLDIPKNLPARDREYYLGLREASRLPRHVEFAEAAIAWAKGLSTEEIEGSDYLYNVNLVARAGFASGKTSGIAASIHAAYVRALGLAKKADAPAHVSEYVGVVGKRSEMTVTLKAAIGLESTFGVVTLCKMVDPAGNDVTWFASSGTDMEIGKTYRVKATVKSHEIYTDRKSNRESKQTVVNRVSIVEELDVEPAPKVVLGTQWDTVTAPAIHSDPASVYRE